MRIIYLDVHDLSNDEDLRFARVVVARLRRLTAAGQLMWERIDEEAIAAVLEQSRASVRVWAEEETYRENPYYGESFEATLTHYIVQVGLLRIVYRDSRRAGSFRPATWVEHLLDDVKRQAMRRALEMLPNGSAQAAWEDGTGKASDSAEVDSHV